MDTFITTIRNGNIAITRTDTLYGILSSVWDKKAVEKIYTIKKRDPKKSLIVLAAHIDDVMLFTGPLSANILNKIKEFWPGPYSIVLPVKNESPIKYIHNATSDIAFRIPNDSWLLEVLKKTGPLVAPSANPEGLAPAKNIDEAQAYFGTHVDYYLNRGPVISTQASHVIKINEDGTIETLR